MKEREREREQAHLLKFSSACAFFPIGFVEDIMDVHWGIMIMRKTDREKGARSD